MSKRMAVCITGESNRCDKALPQLLRDISKFAKSVDGQIDLFVYVSSFKKSKECVKYLKSKLFERIVLYHDKELSPNISAQKFGLRNGFLPENLFQQLYALKRCYEMAEGKSHSLRNFSTHSH